MKKKTLAVLTKKWGRNYTGATLATQYFVDRWASRFDRVVVFTLEIGNCDNTKRNISVLKTMESPVSVQITIVSIKVPFMLTSP